ncbi:mandelate racemase/muconate lactonizing enzyme family protein [Halorubrum vacuolatum]|uniref:o-succinylbenzoate synthase n=1 Tax=Halorubrum vacuolatum TaxID=63740 RepID=A0A238VEW9_HALVU|nr:enolase C-terminal domain-like protein [Halorubrum vacuolatum]SNR32069.1 o-succinylbenzoate synthase [Halorubrum vacuolatum]
MRRRFSLPLSTPLATAHGTITEREGFLVAIDPEGSAPARGIGEATPLPGWTESLEACVEAIDRFGVDPIRLPPAGETPAARHGVALARDDAAARAAGIRLADRLLAVSSSAEETERGRDAGSLPSSIPVNATVGDGSVGRTVEAAERAVKDGYGCLKIKVGAREVEKDLDRVRAVRRAVGSAVDLRVDANGAWSREAAREALDHFNDVNLEYVEQPVSGTDLAGLAAVRDGSPVPVAADEAVAAHGVEAVLDAAAADLLILKPMALGGPDRAVAAARRAMATGVDAVVTTTIDGVIARTAGVHVAAAIETLRKSRGRPLRAAGLATGHLLAEDLAPDPCPVERGRIAVPSGPGLAGSAFDDVQL